MAWRQTEKIDYLNPRWINFLSHIQFIPRNMHTVFALLCFVVVIHWLVFPYPSGLLHWHCGNLTIVPVPAKQPWWIWINTSWEFVYERLHNHNKAKHNKTVCIFIGIYCICVINPQWINTIRRHFLVASTILPRMQIFRSGLNKDIFVVRHFATWIFWHLIPVGICPADNQCGVV